jgi:hypothetical protein
MKETTSPMKNLIAPAALVVIAGLLGATPLAHADSSQAAFVHQVQSMGIGGTSDDILNNGYVMCNTLRTTDLDIHTVAVQAAVDHPKVPGFRPI